VYVFDPDRAQRAVRFIEECCRHVKGEWYGELLKLEDWQREDIVEPLFGWLRPDGTRRYRRVYVEIPKKNGKSTLGASIANVLLFADDEMGAEVYSAAADRDQAAIVFDVAKQMVELEPEMDNRAHVWRRSIVVPQTASFYRVLSSDVKTKHGLNWHGVIFDEFHTQPTRDLYDTLKGGGISRRQPMFVMFTTSGYDKQSICYELHDYATKLCEGIIEDDTFLAVIYGAEADEDWHSPDVWAAANPNLGISVKIEYLDEQCREATESPAAQNTFRRLHLDQWTESAERWLDAAAWNRNAGEYLNVKRGAPCYAGLDLASTTDLAALVLAFPDDESETYDLVPFFWVPEVTAEQRTRKERVQYQTWIDRGLIIATEGNVIDYDVIRRDINNLGDIFNIVEIAADPHNAIQLITQLDGDGFEIFAHRQGFMSLSPGAKELQKLVLGARLRHEGNEVLAWNIANVVVETDAAGNIKPSKKRSTEKIDGAVAAVMAIGRASVNPDAGRSVYDDEGIDYV